MIVTSSFVVLSATDPLESTTSMLNVGAFLSMRTVVVAVAATPAFVFAVTTISVAPSSVTEIVPPVRASSFSAPPFTVYVTEATSEYSAFSVTVTNTFTFSLL